MRNGIFFSLRLLVALLFFYASILTSHAATPKNTGWLENDIYSVELSSGTIYWNTDSGRIPLYRTQLQVFRDDWSHIVIDQTTTYLIKKASKNTAHLIPILRSDAETHLTVDFLAKPKELIITYKIQYNGSTHGFFKPRILINLLDSQLPLLRASPGKPDLENKNIAMDHGPLCVNLKISKTDLSYAGFGGTAYLPLNLSMSPNQNLEHRSISISFYFNPKNLVETMRRGQEIVDAATNDLRAWLEAAQFWDVEPTDQFSSQNEIDEAINQSRRGEFAMQVATPLQAWINFSDIANHINSLTANYTKKLPLESPFFKSKSRDFNKLLKFRAGISFDPKGAETSQWPFFSINLVRLDTGNPFDFDIKNKKILSLLRDLESYGMKAVLKIDVNGGPPEDFVDANMTDRFLLQQRPSFMPLNPNSARLRDEATLHLARWINITSNYMNVLAYSLGNEPFWSTKSSPIYGYDLPTIGCSSEKIFQAKFLKAWGNIEAWQQVSNKLPTGGLATWRNADDIKCPAGTVRGLTWVDFLQQKYGSIQALNRAWSVRSRPNLTLGTWNNLFPPLPLSNSDQSTNQPLDSRIEIFDDLAKKITNPVTHYRPHPDDVPMWVDWIAFWPNLIANRLQELRRSVKTNVNQTGKDILLTSNGVTGHFINGIGNSPARTGLNPWQTLSGLDAIAADFYTIQFLQAYARTFTQAADGRPIYVFETGGLDDPTVTYMLLFSFAYGIDALMFWNPEQQIPPRVAIKFLMFNAAISDSMLQSHSTPVTDNVVLVYPQQALFVEDGMSGSASRTLLPFQSVALALEKLQIQYQVICDCDLPQSLRTSSTSLKVIILSGAFAISNTVLSALEEFRRKGGLVIVTDDFAVVDEHGISRNSNKNFSILMQTQDLMRWHKEVEKYGSNPLPWRNATEAVWIMSLGRTIATKIKPAAKYLRLSENHKAPSPVALRVAHDRLFAFVDPWAEPMRVRVRGRYAGAVERFAKTQLSVRLIHEKEEVWSEVTVTGGPAIVDFSRVAPQ